MSRLDKAIANVGDTISRRAAYFALVEKGQASRRYKLGETWELNGKEIKEVLDALPPAQPEIVRCKDCKYWKQQTNYQSFGFCENNDIWTYTDDDYYCGYAERK